ncbi:MAG: [Fe-S]-binding protein, partial [Gemmatimonadetes bacterium]|nr:[Fe-S]-binding protein [Gemmatimonadota bacterium]
MSLPRMLRVRQHFSAPTVEDIPAAVRAEVQRLNLGPKVKPGETIAISVGSRGIANIALVIKSLVAEFKTLGL